MLRRSTNPIIGNKLLEGRQPSMRGYNRLNSPYLEYIEEEGLTYQLRLYIRHPTNQYFKTKSPIHSPQWNITHEYGPDKLPDLDPHSQFNITYNSDNKYTITCNSSCNLTFFKIPQLPKKVRLSMGDYLNLGGEYLYEVLEMKSSSKYEDTKDPKIIIPREIGEMEEIIDEEPSFTFREAGGEMKIIFKVDEKKREFRIGRSEESDHCIPDQRVSEYHAVIGYEQGLGWFIAEPEEQITLNGSHLALKTHTQIINNLSSSPFLIYNKARFYNPPYLFEVGYIPLYILI